MRWPPTPWRKQGLGKKPIKKSDPGASRTPLSLGTLFFTARGGLSSSSAGWREKGVLSPPPSSSYPLLSASHPRLAIRGQAERGRPCGPGRLGALREEAQASGKAWFAKLTLTLAGFANPKPGPESEPLADLPLGWRELMNGPRSSPRDSGLGVEARAAVGSLELQPADPNLSY